MGGALLIPQLRDDRADRVSRRVEAMTGVEFDFYAKSFKTWFGKDLTPPQIGFPIEYK